MEYRWMIQWPNGQIDRTDVHATQKEFELYGKKDTLEQKTNQQKEIEDKIAKYNDSFQDSNEETWAHKSAKSLRQSPQQKKRIETGDYDYTKLISE